MHITFSAFVQIDYDFLGAIKPKWPILILFTLDAWRLWFQ